jgi:hypothetical protein
MLRASKITLPFAGNHTSRRRQHKFVPSITGAASCLEDRTLLSGAAASAHQAAAAALAETPAGRHVTAMFESILNTAPTQHQVTQWVHEIRGGKSINALKRQLTTEARAEAATKAAIAADPTVSVSPTGMVTVGGTSTGSSTTGSVLPSSTIGGNLPSSTVPLGVAASLPAGLTSGVVGMFNSASPTVTVSNLGVASINSGISQLPIGTTFSSSTGTGTSASTLASELNSLLSGTTGTSASTLASELNSLLPNTTTSSSSASTLASELDSLLSNATTSSSSASTLSSELASLLSSGSIGTTTSTSGSAVTSALDSQLASGVNSITGTTSITGATGVLPGSSLTFTPTTTVNTPVSAIIG